MASKHVRMEQAYRLALDAYLKCGPERIFFYWKGRVALYAILKAMGVGPGDEVLVQGYTCVVVANAIMYLGATPIYADIDLATYNYNMDSLRSKITEKTKVIICQNTYGLSSNLEEIERIGKECGIYTIEDCTHGFGGKYHGKPNGVSCDASFFSTQWSKPFTTGVGGFSVVHNPEIREKVAAMEKEKLQPSSREVMNLRLMYFVRAHIINDFTYWPMIRLYRWLSRRNIVVGSSSGEEIVGVKMPDGYFKAQSTVQMKKGLKSLKKLDGVNERRKKNAQAYTEFLKNHGKNHVDESLFADHIFIRYPLLVNNREEFKKKAEAAGVILGEWFEDPIYPADAPLETWGVKCEELPNAMWVCKHVVNLGTDERKMDKAIAFAESELDAICAAKQ